MQTATAVAAPDVPGRRLIPTSVYAAMAGRHEDTIRAMVARGEGPRPIRIGGRLMFKLAEVEFFLAGGSNSYKATDAPAARTAATR